MRKRGGLWLRDVGLYAHRAQHAILFLIVYVQILHDNAIKRNHLEILKKKKRQLQEQIQLAVVQLRYGMF